MAIIRKNKILYSHIAKTAGTSLNNFIASHFKPEQVLTHVETNPYWNDVEKIHFFEEKLFLSGHINVDVFLEKLPCPTYFRLVTFRRPIDQLVSHIAYVRHLSDPSQKKRLSKHPVQVQELSRKLTTLNLENPEVVNLFITNFNEQEAGLFDNVQTRYLLKRPWPERVSNVNLKEAVQRLNMLDLSGIVERYWDLLRALSWYMGWTEPVEENSKPRGLKKLHWMALNLISSSRVRNVSEQMLNVGTSTYGMDSNSKDFQDALGPAIAVDNLLYQEAVRLFDKQFEPVLTSTYSGE